MASSTVSSPVHRSVTVRTKGAGPLHRCSGGSRAVTLSLLRAARWLHPASMPRDFLLAIDLDRLRTFVAAAAVESFSRAASTRGVTPAAISQQVRTLEEQLGVPLFDRLGKRLRLSPHGRDLVRRVQPALQQIDDSLVTLHESFEARIGVVRIGTPRALGRHWARERVAHVLRLHPDLRVHLRLGASARLERRLVEGGLDLALLTRDPVTPGLETVPLIEASMIAVAAPAYLAQHPVRTERELRKARWAAYDGQRSLLMQWWRARFGNAPQPDQVVLQVADLDMLLDFVLAGLCLCVLPSYLVENPLERGLLVRVATAGEPRGVATTQTVHLAWRGSAPQPSRVTAVARALALAHQGWPLQPAVDTR